MLKDNNKDGPCLIPNCDKSNLNNNLLLVSVETASDSVKLGCCGFKLLSLQAPLWEGSLTRGVLACVEETKLFNFLGCLTFVRTGRPDWSVRKWSSENWENWFWPNWPCSWSRTAQFSRPYAERERSEWPNSWRQCYLFSLFKGRLTKCICSLGAKKLASSSNIVDVIQKWLLNEAIQMIATNFEFEEVRNFR